jgi:hypothetical protein
MAGVARRDSVPEVCSKRPAQAAVVMAGRLEDMQRAVPCGLPLLGFRRARFFLLRRGAMQSWSSQGAYAKGRLSEQELDLRFLKHMDQEGRLLQLSFVEKCSVELPGGRQARYTRRKLVELRASSQSEAGEWFKGIEASLRSIAVPIKYSLEDVDEPPPTYLHKARRLVDQCFAPKCNSKGERTYFL